MPRSGSPFLTWVTLGIAENKGLASVRSDSKISKYLLSIYNAYIGNYPFVLDFALM